MVPFISVFDIFLIYHNLLDFSNEVPKEFLKEIAKYDKDDLIK